MPAALLEKAAPGRKAYPMTYKVAYIVGSLSSNSINRKLVGAMIADAPSDLEFVEADFSKLPLYSPDYDADYPQIATDFKKILEDADAVLIATPEYDRSIPGGLKNAIDWLGRPWGSNPIGGKPVYVVGASMGAVGAALGQISTRQTLGFFNPLLMTQPEVYMKMSHEDIGEDGRFIDAATQGFVKSAIEAFADYIRSHA